MIEEFRANLNLVNKRLAEDSHKGTSFDPEKRAAQEIEGFGQYVNEVYDNLKKYAKTEAQQSFLNSEMDRFQHGFAVKYNDRLAAQARTISSFITGGSNFPVRRAQKANVAEDKRYEEMIEYRDRAQAVILRELKKMGVEEAGGELEVLKTKIADAERNHEFMVKANTIVRKKIPDDQKIREIMALGKISETTVREILKPDYMGRIGFPAYALSNDTANIHRMKERLIELEKREVTPTADIPFTGGHIIDNREADRVQIIFDQKPAEAILSKLRSEGWRWAPSVGAWSRKRTDAALYSARRILGLEAKSPGFVPVKEEPKIDDEVHARIQKVIDIMKIYRDKGATFEDLGAGLKGVYLERSGYVMGSNLNIQKLTDDLKKSGYDNLRELWRKIIVQAPAAPPIPVPQPQAVPELRWVFGTREEKWYLVGPEYIDYVHGITQERMKQIGVEDAKAEYLSPTLMRAAAPAQQVSAVPGNIDNVIALMEQYVKDGKSYEDFVAGLKGYYLPQSGYQINNHLDAERLKADLEKAGYYTLTELWNDTSRKLRMRMYVPPKHLPLLYPAPVSPEVKKYTTPRTFKKGTIARNNITNEKFVLETDVEALQEDKNAMIWRTNEGHHIYIDDQRPAATPITKEPDKISSDDTQILKSYEKISDYAINQRITLNQGKLKELAARRVVRIEKGQYGTMGSAYLEQERLGISEEISRLRRVLDLRELIIAQARPEPWKLTQEEYWRAGAGGKAYEGRGTSDYNHKEAVYKAIIAGKPVSANVLKDYPDLIRREVPAPSPKIQSIHDVKQQVIKSIQAAKSMDELKQILKGFGFLPLPEPEKRQLMDLYQSRFSELMGELKFGERIPEEEKKKRRAPQKAPYAPPTRRLEEYGIKEAMRRGYGYA